MKVGLCLSGGGVKGAAHIGVLKALEEENIKIDCIAGTSSGSIVSALYAMGYKADEIYNLFKKYGKEISKVNIKNIIKLILGLLLTGQIVIEGLNDGKKLYKIIQEHANKKKIIKMRDITMPLIIPSVNLYNGEILLFSSLNNKRQYSDNYIIQNNIEVGKAVQASCSYPGIFCPVDYKNKKLIDGGVRENTPWKELKEIGCDKVISVVFEKDKEEKKEMNMLDCIIDSIGILSHELYNYEMLGTDYLLQIKTQPTSLLDIKKMDELYHEGYRQAKKQIDKIKQYLHSK